MYTVNVSDKKTENLFLKLPETIYKNDANWIPHLRQDIERIFSPEKNKTFQQGKVERWLLFNSKDEPIGRIAAFINNRTVDKTSYPTGGLGFFECIDNQESANLLFETGIKWLTEQGMQAVEAPINFGENNEFWGLLIENFIDPPTYLMNYNPPYYQKLFEEYGFQVYYKQLMFHRQLSEPAQEVFVQKALKMRADPKFSCTNIRNMTLNEVADNFLQIYNDAWKTHKGFKELSQEKARKIIYSLKEALDPDIFIFAFYENRPIGFYINLPELNQIFKYINGDLNLIGKLKFVYHKWRKTATTMYGLAFGIARDFQGQGVEGAMIKFAEETIVPQKVYTDTIQAWIGDFNPKMLKVVENLGAKKFRTFATYRKILVENGVFEPYPTVNID